MRSAIEVPRSAAIRRNRWSTCSGATTVVRRMAALCHTCHHHATRNDANERSARRTVTSASEIGNLVSFGRANPGRSRFFWGVGVGSRG
jgi:hypothetical protein